MEAVAGAPKKERKEREAKPGLRFESVKQQLESKEQLKEHLAQRMSVEDPKSRAQYIVMSLRQFLGATVNLSGSFVLPTFGTIKPVLLVRVEDMSAANEIWREVRDEALQSYELHEKIKPVAKTILQYEQANLPFGEVEAPVNTTTVGSENKLESVEKKPRKKRISKKDKALESAESSDEKAGE